MNKNKFQVVKDSHGYAAWETLASTKFRLDAFKGQFIIFKEDVVIRKITDVHFIDVEGNTLPAGIKESYKASGISVEYETPWASTFSSWRCLPNIDVTASLMRWASEFESAVTNAVMLQNSFDYFGYKITKKTNEAK